MHEISTKEMEDVIITQQRRGIFFNRSNPTYNNVKCILLWDLLFLHKIQAVAENTRQRHGTFRAYIQPRNLPN